MVATKCLHKRMQRRKPRYDFFVEGDAKKARFPFKLFLELAMRREVCKVVGALKSLKFAGQYR